MRNAVQRLALGNLLLAIGFVLPVLVWIVADHVSRGSLEVVPHAVGTDDQRLSRIRAYTNIEDLRREAVAQAQLTEHLEVLAIEIQRPLIDRLLRFWWAVLGIAGAAFSANAAILYWAYRRLARAL